MQMLSENTFTQLNKDGYMEIIDMLSGKIVAVQKSRESVLIGNVDRAREVTLENGDKMWVELGINHEGMQLLAYPYSLLQAEAIACLIAEGNSLRMIARRPGFPSLQIMRRWRTDHPEFEERLRNARKDRADYYVDKVIDAAEAATDKEDAPAAKIKIDAFRWAAGVDDPDMYANKAKVQGDAAVPITIIVNTGISRGPSVSPGESIETTHRLVHEDEEIEVSSMQALPKDF